MSNDQAPRVDVSETDYATIGKIFLNWSRTDHGLGRVLEDVVFGGQKNIKIYEKKIGKKLELIEKHSWDEQPAMRTVIDELRFAIEGSPWLGRNILAHGILLVPRSGHDEAIFYSRNRETLHYLSDLAGLLAWSRYAALLSKRLWLLAHGVEVDDPMPARPSSLPVSTLTAPTGSTDG